MVTGDHIRYSAGGRPDAIVERSDHQQASIVYDQPWQHPWLNRTVVAQRLDGAELQEWHVIGEAA